MVISHYETNSQASRHPGPDPRRRGRPPGQVRLRQDDHGGRGQAGRHRQGHDLPPFSVQGGARPGPYRPHRRDRRPEAPRERPAPSDSVDRRLRRMLVLRVLHRFDSVAHYSQSLGDLLSSVRTALLVRRAGHFEKEAAVFEERPPRGRPARVPRLPRSPDGLARPHPEHEFPASRSASRPESSAAREEVEDQVGRIADLLIKGLLSCPSRPASWTR